MAIGASASGTAPSPVAGWPEFAVPKPGRTEAPSLVTIMTGSGANLLTHELPVGTRFTVGSCRCHECGCSAIVGVGPGIWVKVEIRVLQDRWTVGNLCVDTDLWCSDLEDSTQRLRIRAGRLAVTVPFEFARFEFRHHGVAMGSGFTAIGHEPSSAPGLTLCVQGHDRLESSGLRAGTAYMAVLDELCRVGTHHQPPPTSDEIRDRLAAQGVELTRRAVDHHIDYLFRRLFPEAQGEVGKPGWKRLAIASFVHRARQRTATSIGSP